MLHALMDDIISVIVQSINRLNNAQKGRWQPIYICRFCDKLQHMNRERKKPAAS